MSALESNLPFYDALQIFIGHTLLIGIVQTDSQAGDTQNCMTRAHSFSRAHGSRRALAALRSVEVLTSDHKPAEAQQCCWQRSFGELQQHAQTPQTTSRDAGCCSLNVNILSVLPDDDSSEATGLNFA